MHLAAPRFRHRMQVIQGLLLALLALVLRLPGAHADDDDASALLAFKSSLGDPPALATWTNGGRTDQGCPLDWSGVTCENGRVAALDLSGRGIAGPIARATLGKLSQLTSLNLSRNAFSGTVPDDLGDFAGLLAMDLSHNSLTGPVPGSVGKLATLLTLRMAGNQLDGAVPEQLADLLQLRELDLSGNRLSGPIPGGAIANLAASLVLLNLSSNGLSGPLPDSFQVFGALETLDLHGNDLTGPVNDSLLSLPVVKWIDLSSNRLGGDFPGKRSQIPAFPSTLEYFNVSNNLLEGPLSSPFSTVIADSLKVLDVSNNQLTEPLPTLKLQRAAVLLFGNNRFSGNVSYTLYNMSPFLQELDLSQNQFVGSLRRVVTSPTLQYLNLSSNQLEGALPQEFEGNCISVDLSRNRFSGGVSSLGQWGSTMETIHISGNLLNGSLPDDAADALSALKSLDASDNRLTGVIPPSFISFRRLETLDVSSNGLSGQVPAFLLNSSSLVSLTLSRNDLSGEIVIPEIVGDLSSSSPPPPSISSLNLSLNHLSGSIPPSIATLSRLYSLDLSHNELSGSIPSTLSTLSALHDLDLSYNHLTGPIPEELGLGLPNLQFLNLSYNDLSGTLPPSLESRFPRSSFDGNPRLRRQGDDGDRMASSGDGGKKGSLSALEAGLIGGFTAAAVVLIAAALFIYYKRVSRSGVHHRGGQQRRGGGMVVKRGGLHQQQPRGGGGPGQEHYFGGGGGAAAAADGCAPVVKPKGILKSHSYRSSAAAAGDRVEDGADGNAEGNGHQVGVPSAPAVPYVQLQSQVQQQQEERLAAAELRQQQQQAVVLRVCSPERLAGDLFLLDSSILFSAEELSRAPAEVLGRSSHGTSYKATLDSGHVLTVKWLREGLAKSRKKFVVEARKFGNVKHPNVMSLRGYYWGPREHEKLLVSDFMPAGSLAGRLYERTGRRYAPLTWHQRLRIAVDMARGLSHLHVEQQWPHGNLKASNVLLVEEEGGQGGGGPDLQTLSLRGRLADYSLHRLVTEAGTANTILNAGALGYRSSELASARKPKPSLEADVYALGVILMEVLTGKGAGDIISGNSGAVDLPDWVRLLANEGRAVDCYDPALVGVHREQEPPPGMDDMLHISLSCIAARSVRPSVKVVYDKLAAINPLPTAAGG